MNLRCCKIGSRGTSNTPSSLKPQKTNMAVWRSFLLPRIPVSLGAIHSTDSNRSDREKRTTSKGGPVFPKLFRLDQTDPLSFGPKFPESLVEWIAPSMSRKLIPISWNKELLDQPSRRVFLKHPTNFPLHLLF